jgi:hypothetical protein
MKSACAWRSARPNATSHPLVQTSALALICAGLAVGTPLAFWSQRFAAHLVDRLVVSAAFRIGVAAE